MTDKNQAAVSSQVTKENKNKKVLESGFCQALFYFTRVNNKPEGSCTYCALVEFLDGNGFTAVIGHRKLGFVHFIRE